MRYTFHFLLLRVAECTFSIGTRAVDFVFGPDTRFISFFFRPFRPIRLALFDRDTFALVLGDFVALGRVEGHPHALFIFSVKPSAAHPSAADWCYYLGALLHVVHPALLFGDPLADSDVAVFALFPRHVTALHFLQ